MLGIPLIYLPRVELVRFRRVDFFPPPLTPKELSCLTEICIGTKTRTIGDAMMLSTLPGKLRALYPGLRITTYPRAFNPVVFYGNPHVSGASYLPRALYGDDNNEGSGHLIQLKERCFGVPISATPRPELHLLESERARARALLRGPREALPLLIIHPWGHTWKNVFDLEAWTTLVQSWSASFRIWQVGIAGHTPIPGCDHHFLTPRAFRHARALFALMENASAFVGVNSGPMHIARAFGVPSAILTEEGDPGKLFERRHAHPYFLHRTWAHAFLYEENVHVDVPALGATGSLRVLGEFLEPLKPSRARPGS